MIRTQVQLSEEQMETLREMSRTSRESVASLVRKAVDQFLATRKPDRLSLYRQALTVAGKYEAGVGDVSTAHDRYLEEAYDK